MAMPISSLISFAERLACCAEGGVSTNTIGQVTLVLQASR